MVGCSSSEIVGGHIGKDSSLEAAQAVYAGIAPVLAQRGIWLAAQCCEHLNRAIIMEREAAEQYGWEEVCVVPRPHAGGSWATTCWKQCKDPIAVEEIRAHAGIDIGGTLIGMHLRRVAVPVRLSLSRIGEANILCARTRPKLIGGERAKIYRGGLMPYGRKKHRKRCGRPCWPSVKRWPPLPGRRAVTPPRSSCAPPARPAPLKPWPQVPPCPLTCLAKTMCRSSAQTLTQALTAASPAISSDTCRPTRSKKVLGRASLIQSVGSEHLLTAIEKEAAKAGIVQNVLLEVNIGGEESKSGVSPEALWPLLDAAAAQEHIRVKGLMAIPPVNDDDAQNRRYLAAVHDLFVKAGERGYSNVEMQTLSMGMSGDYENAIREGATLVRIGTAIYGERDYSKK